MDWKVFEKSTTKPDAVFSSVLAVGSLTVGVDLLQAIRTELDIIKFG